MDYKEFFMEYGYQYVAGLVAVLFWVFKTDARSKQNEKDIDHLREDLDSTDSKVESIKDSVTRMEAIYEGTEKSIDKIDGKLDRLIRDNKNG